MQAKALKQRKILSREGVCPATLWLTEEYCNTQIERASRKIADWHNKLRQAAGPGRTQAEKNREKKREKNVLAAVQGITEMNVIRGHRAVYRCHLHAVTQDRAAPCTSGRNNSCITSSILGVLVLCRSGQTLAGGFHITLSAHFSAAIVSCPIHTIIFINT